MEGNQLARLKDFLWKDRFSVSLIKPSKEMCDTEFLGSIPFEDYKWRSRLEEKDRR